MKIVYRGGYNKEIVQKSFWYDYLNLVKKLLRDNKRVALVTLAKPDDYYTKFINEWPRGVEIINNQTGSMAWNDFDVIVIPGGDSGNLSNGLKKFSFDLQKLKQTAIVIGDSAGSYVLSSYFYDSPPGEDRGKIIRFLEGFNPEAKIITIAHTNNPKYTNELLIEKVTKFSRDHDLRILKLAENQEKLLDATGNFVDFDRNKLFE